MHKSLRNLYLAIFTILMVQSPSLFGQTDETLSLPHEMTADELLRKHEIGKSFVETTPPAGAIRAIAEFEQMEGVTPLVSPIRSLLRCRNIPMCGPSLPIHHRKQLLQTVIMQMVLTSPIAAGLLLHLNLTGHAIMVHGLFIMVIMNWVLLIFHTTAPDPMMMKFPK
jgi:hypothetical protein